MSKSWIDEALAQTEHGHEGLAADPVAWQRLGDGAANHGGAVGSELCAERLSHFASAGAQRIFLWPLGASVAASFTREGTVTLANYETVWRLYLRDVGYTLGVAAAGSALTFAVAIPVCGWLRARAFAPVEFLLKVPLFVPFVVSGFTRQWHFTFSATLLTLF